MSVTKNFTHQRFGLVLFCSLRNANKNGENSTASSSKYIDPEPPLAWHFKCPTRHDGTNDTDRCTPVVLHHTEAWLIGAFDLYMERLMVQDLRWRHGVMEHLIVQNQMAMDITLRVPLRRARR